MEDFNTSLNAKLKQLNETQQRINTFKDAQTASVKAILTSFCSVKVVESRITIICPSNGTVDSLKRRVIMPTGELTPDYFVRVN